MSKLRVSCVQPWTCAGRSMNPGLIPVRPGSSVNGRPSDPQQLSSFHFHSSLLYTIEYHYTCSTLPWFSIVISVLIQEDFYCAGILQNVLLKVFLARMGQSLKWKQWKLWWFKGWYFLFMNMNSHFKRSWGFTRKVEWKTKQMLVTTLVNGFEIQAVLGLPASTKVSLDVVTCLGVHCPIRM